MRLALNAILVLLAAFVLAACATTAASTADETPAAAEGGVIPVPDARPDHFSWIDEGRMAGLSDPRTGGPAEGQGYEWALAWLKEHGVDVLVSLTNEAPPTEPVEAAGIHHVHIPVHDFKAPTLSQLQNFVKIASGRILNGNGVAVHCTAGVGRTGTFLAAWLVHQGMEADAAIAKVRELRPGSVETPEQEASVRDLAASAN